MKKTLIALGAAFAAMPVFAGHPHGFDAASQAAVQGPKGFDAGPVSTVTHVLNTAKDHQIVTLRGKFTGHIKGDKYVFTDTEGNSIKAELDDDKDWSMITKDAPVEIRAEVDKDWNSTELEVISAQPL